MNVYLNKNCNGFKWFMLEGVEDCELPTLMKSPSLNEGYPSLGNIMMWEEFSLILVHEGGAYLLSIDGLEEKGLDVYGRPVNMKIIFVDDDYNKIVRILLAYAGYKGAFDEWMNKVFWRDSKGVCCDSLLLNKVLDCIYSAKVQPEFRCVKNSKLMFVETCIKDPEKFAQHFNLDLSNVKNVFKKCSQTIMGRYIMTSNPFENKSDKGDGNGEKGENFPAVIDEPPCVIKENGTNVLKSSQKEKINRVCSECNVDKGLQDLKNDLEDIQKKCSDNLLSVQCMEKEIMAVKVRFCRFLCIIVIVAIALVIAVVLLYLKKIS